MYQSPLTAAEYMLLSKSRAILTTDEINNTEANSPIKPRYLSLRERNIDPQNPWET